MTPLAATTTSAAPTAGARSARSGTPDGSFADLFSGCSTAAPAERDTRATGRPTRQDTRATAATSANDTTGPAATEAATEAVTDGDTGAVTDGDTGAAAESATTTAASDAAADASADASAGTNAAAAAVLTARDAQAALEVNAQLRAGLTTPAENNAQPATDTGRVDGSEATSTTSTTSTTPVREVTSVTGAARTLPVHPTDAPALLGSAAPVAAAASDTAGDGLAAATPTDASTEAAAPVHPTAGPAQPATAEAPTAAPQTPVPAATGDKAADSDAAGGTQAADTLTVTASETATQPHEQDPTLNQGQDSGSDTTNSRPAPEVVDPTTAAAPAPATTPVIEPPHGQLLSDNTTATAATPASAVTAATAAPAHPALAAPARPESPAGATFVDSGVGIDDPAAATVLTRAVPERDGNTKLIMRLDPPDLGSLAITMRRDAAGLHVQVTADAALTPAQVQQLRESATQAAQAADTQLADFSASQGHASDRDHDSQDRGRTIRLAPVEHALDERPATPRLTGTGTVVWL